MEGPIHLTTTNAQWKSQTSFDCVLCINFTEETLDHLFFHGSLASSCLNIVNFRLTVDCFHVQAFDISKTSLAWLPFFMDISIPLCS